MQRKKIVLYNPLAVFFDMPLALLAIGSHLDQNKYEVIIIDARVETNAHQKVLEIVGEALCFGVTALTGRPLKDALEISQKVKGKFAKIPVIWGGWHPSLFAKEILEEESSIDITVFGQGEETFKELVDHLNDGSALSSIDGIAYRNAQNEVYVNKARSLEEMNHLTTVDYSLINPELYFKAKKRRQFDYISSTGCRFRCTFCADPFVYNRKWTAIDPQRMGEELAYWKKKYPFDDINFQDETFFTNRLRVSSIAQEFLDRNMDVTWAGTMRADQGSRLSDEEFMLAKDSGLRRVLVGVESGSQEMLDWLKKDIKLDQIWHVAQQCKQLGISVIFPFIVGFPGETESSVTASLKMARELRATSSTFTTPIFYFKPYPGSQITNQAVAEGFVLPNSLKEWTDFDFVDGSSRPWVSNEMYQKVELFKFYNKLAFGHQRWYLSPLQNLAKMRMTSEFFGFPVEKYFANLLMPSKQLS